jgi:type VI secretion system protein ImpA
VNTPLDIDSLLLPIPGENPAGRGIPFPLREKLELGRKETLSGREGDGPFPAPSKPADWETIVDSTREALKTAAKDLQLAARMTEALVRLHGFAGLRDGLCLLKRLVTDCWDRLHPPGTGPEDLEVRAAAFYWLDDPHRGACFPSTLRLVPLVADENRTYCWRDWYQARQGRGAVDHQSFERAVRLAAWEHFNGLAADLEGCQQEFRELVAVLEEKIGANAPALNEVRHAVADCHQLVQEIMQKGISSMPIEAEAVASGSQLLDEIPQEQAGAAWGPFDPVALREQLYRQVEQIAQTLQQLEPHSPIPYLLYRAVRLGNLPFPQLMKELLRDSNAMKELNREFGINDESGPKR